MSRFFINRPIFAIVVSLIIVILGTLAAFSLPVAQYPQISPPTIRVGTTYTGANSDTVNETVAQVIEQQVNGVEGNVVPNAILIPQRAVQQVLEKTFVMVVGEDGKSVTKPITVGDKVGSFWVVTDGLSANDTVIVEGLTRLQEGIPLNVTMVTPEDLGLTF